MPTPDDIVARDAWLARINAHLPADGQLDESDLSPVDLSGGGGL